MLGLARKPLGTSSGTARDVCRNDQFSLIQFTDSVSDDPPAAPAGDLSRPALVPPATQGDAGIGIRATLGGPGVLLQVFEKGQDRVYLLLNHHEQTLRDAVLHVNGLAVAQFGTIKPAESSTQRTPRKLFDCECDEVALVYQQEGEGEGEGEGAKRVHLARQ